MKKKKQLLLIERKIYKYRRHRPKRVKRRYGSSVALCKSSSLKFFLPFSINIFYKRFNDRRSKRVLDTNKISVPEIFSFYHNFDQSVTFFKNIISSFVEKEGHIIADFSKCRYVCISTLTLLRILYDEFVIAQERYKQIDNRSEIRKLKIIPSYREQKVKKYLHAFGYYEYDDFNDEDGEVLPLDLIRGKYRNSYRENTKTKAIQQIVDFINSSFEPINKCLSPNGLNIIESLVSEILNNAEDHSHRNCEWYAHGIAFNEKQLGEKVVELNLAIINFGNSMYEGFEETKELNSINYNKVDSKFISHSKLFSSQCFFERESLFMLYMLNEGISRLKFADSSRGNGTMQFLQAFTTLGSFGGQNVNFNSLLNVISGHTVLSCDNKVGPYTEGNHLKLSLNEEKELSLLPNREYLKYNKEFFPGTIIECKIYLNEQFFDEILKNGKK